MLKARTLILYFLFMLGWVTLTQAAAPTPCEPSVILASATAEMKGENDSAEMIFGVITENQHLEKAQQENAQRSAAIFKAVQALKLKHLSVKTSSFSVTPKWDETKPAQPIVGYQIESTLNVTIENLKGSELSQRVTQVLETALIQGANVVRQLNFYINDRQPLIQQALEQAVFQARQKVKVLAKAADVELKKIIKIEAEPMQEVPFLQANYLPTAEMKDTRSVVPPIETGESKVIVTVHMTYEIK